MAVRPASSLARLGVDVLNVRAQPPGSVAVVGAGPGAPDLLTVRACQRVRDAQVLVWADSLVSPAVAALAPADCIRMSTRSLTLETVMEVMLEKARAGKRVVRLHDGDPCLYGALHEQICRLAEAGVDVEVVPGVSAYQATAAALGQALTIPGLVQTVVLTRASGRTGTPEREALKRVARLQASLCLYLSARHVEAVQEELLLHYPADTPVAVAFRVSWPDERLLITSLAAMAATTAEHKLIRTTLYLVSPALAASPNCRSRLYAPGHSHLFRGGQEQSFSS